jgi:hypothetical protein
MAGGQVDNEAAPGDKRQEVEEENYWEDDAGEEEPPRSRP